MSDSNKISGCLYLIPSLLSPEALDSMPPAILQTITTTHHFFVENERTARRFFKKLDHSISIDDRHFSVINRHHEADTRQLKEWLSSGLNVGIVSEAGYPCIADPGHVLVEAAHHIHARIVPLSGPNAMLMALSASGFNGQAFRFSGYIPRKSHLRTKALKNLAKQVQKYNETQIFMEAPYRNDKLVEDIIRQLPPNLKLCIAVDITGEEEFIESRKIKDWKQHQPKLHKKPAVFLLGN
ncbi:MAG TPA: SAM-dependent methyltransferase [Chitinophagaceae bacterium]|nr:SAM-dependent methyltransferase [Chitinophagaceae bacterium]